MNLSIQPIIISTNRLCPYCGVELTALKAEETNVEHVVARRFTPRCYLDGQTNLVVNSCKKCNQYKAELEGDLSPMTFSLTGDVEYPPDVVQDIERKLGTQDCLTGSIRGAAHPETRQPVANSFGEHTIHGTFGNARLSFGLTSPPQAFDSEAELARLHIQAFYFMIANGTLDENGGYKLNAEDCVFLPRKIIHPLFILRRSDWGNAAANELENRTSDWEPCFSLNTAHGYFKGIMRRDASREISPVFWALEWNQSIRILGMIREQNTPDTVEQGLPELKYYETGMGLRVRQEECLAQDIDRLFE